METNKAKGERVEQTFIQACAEAAMKMPASAVWVQRELYLYAESRGPVISTDNEESREAGA